MYLKHYNFQHLPFRNTPDPKFFFATSKHNEALANLVYAVEQRRGFVLLTGEIGSGKTLVTHLLLKQIEDHALVALIRNTHLNSTQLIRLICDEFSVRVGEQNDKAGMLMALNQFLIQQLSEDRLVVIIIDEAQNLSDKVLEELRMLSNLETSSDKLIQIVMVGQPELRDKIAQPQLEQLRQRIALSYHLEPLAYDEVLHYVEHRLKIAGPEHKARFTPAAIEKIFRFSRGMPRVINGICDNALLYGFTAGKLVIDEDLIDKVLKQSMHLAPRQRIGPIRTPTYTAQSAPAPRIDMPPPQPDSEPEAGKKKIEPLNLPPPAAIDLPAALDSGDPRNSLDSPDSSSPLASVVPPELPPAEIVSSTAASAPTPPSMLLASETPPTVLPETEIPAASPLIVASPQPDPLEPVIPVNATSPPAAAAALDELPEANGNSTPAPSSVPLHDPALDDSIVLCVPVEALFNLPAN